MKRIYAGAAALIAAGLVASAASAATVVITSSNPQGWSNPVPENSGGGSAAITATSPRSGDGSVELFGDRTRWVLGDAPKTIGPVSDLGDLTDFLDLAFEYRIDPASTSNLGDPQYSPALRLTVWDGGEKSEFVYERAYQTGGYGGAGPLGTWNATSSSSTFYKREVNPLTNTLLNPNEENDQRTLATWATDFSANAYVTAVYVGVGSSVGANYNFEVAGAAVPEPATWGLMIIGFGAAGSMIRRRRGVAVAA